MRCLEGMVPNVFTRANSVILGVQGFDMFINEHGDAEGNYTVLSRQYFNGSTAMLQLGDFQVVKGSTDQSELVSGESNV